MSNNISSPNLRPDLPYWLVFSRITGIGPVRFKKLINFFPDMEIAWRASADELLASGLEENIVRDIASQRNQLNPVEEMEKMLAAKVSAITILDSNYPKLLAQIYAPPALLFYKGAFSPAQDEFALAVVGTRKFSPYGGQVTPILTTDLSRAGLVIVSGMALGIDSLAHEAALSAAGRTIAVLGSGLDEKNIYPSYNRYLCQKIVDQGGLVISEYPVGSEALKHNFPQRNRIIAGLSLGTLVMEAPEDSGALLTARFALEQNREIFAVPGSIFSDNSIGPHNLIKMGAKLITSANDILEALDLNLAEEFVATKNIVPDSLEEAKILAHLSHEPMHVDELVRLSKLDAAVINSTLTLMEMKGRVRNIGSMSYVLAR